MLWSEEKYTCPGMQRLKTAGPDKLTSMCRNEMKSFFEASINDIIESIEEQVEQAENDGRCVRVWESRLLISSTPLTQVLEYRHDWWVR